MANLTRTEYLTYVKKTFKREDKDDELVDALQDTLYDMSTNYEFQVSETETDLVIASDTYKYTYPSDYALLVSNVVYIDSGGSGRALTKLSKTEFDEKYPDISSTTFITGDPEDYMIYANEIYIAPYIKSVTSEKLYLYGADVAAVLGASDSPVYKDRFREVIKFGTLYRAYSDLDMDDKAAKYELLYRNGVQKMIDVDQRKNTGQQYVNCSRDL